jgi:hypothetical protein
MPAVYHKITLVEHVVFNALETPLRRLNIFAFGDSFVIVSVQINPPKFIKFFFSSAALFL